MQECFFCFPFAALCANEVMACAVRDGPKSWPEKWARKNEPNFGLLFTLWGTACFPCLPLKEHAHRPRGSQQRGACVVVDCSFTPHSCGKSDLSMTIVKPFYEGKSVLITGATGFIGKVLLEKMLRDIPGIATFYVIIRRCVFPLPHPTLHSCSKTILSYTSNIIPL